MNREQARKRAARRCWSTEGVLGGDRSCPELALRAHCRECGVLVVAAHELLARVPADDDGAGASGFVPTDGSAGRADAHDAGQPFSVITFDVGGANLALEARRVVEVSTPRAVRRVPHRASDAFLGLVNVQGRLEPCFSLAVVLGLPPDDGEAERRLVVVGAESRRCAFYAQRPALREADHALLGEPPATVSAALDTHVRAIIRFDERPWSWLDADRLLASMERALS